MLGLTAPVSATAAPTRAKKGAFLFLVPQVVTVERRRRPSAADRVQGGNGMKIRHPLFFALVAACAVSLASTAVSAVAAETPFKGTVSAVETGTTVFPIRTTTREGTGTATYLGRYTEHVTEQINVLAMSSTGAATFTAANGDTLSASEVGHATPDRSHDALNRRGLHRHRRNGTLRWRNRHLHAGSHRGADNGRWSRHVQRSHRPLDAVRGHFKPCSAWKGNPRSLGRILHVHFVAAHGPRRAARGSRPISP